MGQVQGGTWSFPADVQQVLPAGGASQHLWGLTAATVPGSTSQSLLSLPAATVPTALPAATVPPALPPATVPSALAAATVPPALPAVTVPPVQSDAISLGMPLSAQGDLMSLGM